MQKISSQYQYYLQCLSLLFILFQANAYAEAEIKPPLVLSSGTKQTTLIELYTSEGCSSCPPADAWLSKLKADPALFRSIIPIAFHVDYWNYLGWTDKFASAENSKRQRKYQRLGHTKSVYTPGFVINGEEWRNFFNPLRRGTIPQADANPGRLILTKAADQIELKLKATPGAGAANRQLVANIAYLGTNLKIPIKSGENRGKLLNHDFVVLKHASARANDNLWQFDLKPPAEATAIAAWISEKDDIAPIQAVGGWLENKNR